MITYLCLTLLFWCLLILTFSVFWLDGSNFFCNWRNLIVLPWLSSLFSYMLGKIQCWLSMTLIAEKLNFSYPPNLPNTVYLHKTAVWTLRKTLLYYLYIHRLKPLCRYYNFVTLSCLLYDLCRTQMYLNIVFHVWLWRQISCYALLYPWIPTCNTIEWYSFYSGWRLNIFLANLSAARMLSFPKCGRKHDLI